MPTEIVKFSNVKFCIWEALASPAALAPGVGVGTELEAELELPPVKGVGVGMATLVAVGRTEVARTCGTGVEVANWDLAASKKGVGVATKTRVGVGANLTVGVGTPMDSLAGAARVDPTTETGLVRDPPSRVSFEATAPEGRQQCSKFTASQK